MTIDALIIGGQLGLHRQRIYPHLEALGINPKWHWDYKKAGGDKDFPPAAQLAIVFTDMVGHVLFERAKSDAARAKVPLVVTNRRRHEYTEAVRRAVSKLLAVDSPNTTHAPTGLTPVWEGYSFSEGGDGWCATKGNELLITGLDSKAGALSWAKQHNRASKSKESKVSSVLKERQRVYRRLDGPVPIPHNPKSGLPGKDAVGLALRSILLTNPDLQYKLLLPAVADLLAELGHTGEMFKNQSSLPVRLTKESLGIFTRGPGLTCVDMHKFGSASRGVGRQSNPQWGESVRPATREDLEWKENTTLGRPRKKAPKAAQPETAAPAAPPESATPASKPTPAPRKGRHSAMVEAKELLSTPQVRLVLGRDLTDNEVMDALMDAGLSALRKLLK